MTASTTNITLGEESQSSYITVTGYSGSINYIISGIEIVSCKWGANSGENNETIELIFTPLLSGTATVYAYLVDADKGITFNITVNKEDPHDKTNLTINEIGGEYKYWINNRNTYNIYKINNAVYEKETNLFGTVNITVTITASCIEQNASGYDWMAIDYKLYNSDGIVIKTDNIYIENYSLFELYQTQITFYNLEPYDYVLYFTDTN